MRKIHNYFISNTPISRRKPASINFFTICSTSLPIWSINLRNHNQVDINKATKTTEFFSQSSLSIKENGRGSNDQKKARKSLNF